MNGNAKPEKAIVVGAGLAGITAALELVEYGCNVTLIEKSSYIPSGNSAKASIGICAPGFHMEGVDAMHLESLAQDSIGDVMESGDEFMKDAVKDVEWLFSRFYDVEKDTKSLEDFCAIASPGKKGNNAVIGTGKALIGQVVCGQAVLCLAKLSKTPLLEIIKGADVRRLLHENGAVIGCEYEDADGAICEAEGIVVLATGGYGGDLSADSIMAKNKPALLQFTTSNNERMDGSGITMAQAVGAGTERLDEVNLYPLACSGPNLGDETDQFKFILSSLILGGGGLLLDKDGNRFCDEKSTAPADISRLMMTQARPPFRVVISADDLPENLQWLLNFYLKASVMEVYTPAALAQEMDVKSEKLEGLVGKRQCYTKIVMPAIYTCCGGIQVTRSNGAVTTSWGQEIPGLYAAGELTVAPSQKMYSKTGVPLMYSISSGRVAGLGAAAYLNGGTLPTRKDLTQLLEWIPHDDEELQNTEEQKQTESDLKTWTKEDLVKLVLEMQEAPPAAAAAPAAPAPPPEPKDEGIPWEEVKKHDKKEDVWVVINGEVIDATNFISKHPGGVPALMGYAGKDASEEWNTIHRAGTVERVGIGLGAKILGKIKGGSAAPPPAAPVGYVEPDAPDGHGLIPGPIGALIYMAFNLLRQIIKTAMNTGNVTFNNERLGTIRSGLFLVLFTVLHSSDNQFTQLGKKQYNGMSFFLADTMQKVRGYQLFDMYIGLAVLLHVSVGLKRSWDLNMGYLISTGKWNYMLTGLCILFFLTNHLIDFRFAELFHEEDYVPTPSMFVPPYGVTLRSEPPFAFFYQEKEAPADCLVPFLCGPGKEVQIRDLFTVCHRIFQDPQKVLQYVAFCAALVGHLFLVWPKIVGAGAFQIPRDHQPWVKTIGLIAAVACGTLYVSVPIRFYLGIIPPP
jgi:succinate dehydrogenase/fumarate reductase flavoprotein subunit